MPVIINEFEVQVAPPPPAAPDVGAGPAEAPPPLPPGPEEILAVVRRHRAREARVRGS